MQSSQKYCPGRLRRKWTTRSAVFIYPSLTMRMRRFTRLTNAFSKKFENHCHALALYFVFYNFCRVHKTLGATPAMASCIVDKVMHMRDIVGMIDAANPVPAVRGPYKKREAVEISN